MPEGRDSVVQIQRMLDRLSTYDPSNHSISKVPDFLRGVNEEAYDPTLVAIGPIHHNRNHVQGMQQHKVWYLRQLLQRKGREQYDLDNRGVPEGSNSYNSPGISEKFEKPVLARYLSALGSWEEKARRYYSSSIQLPKKEEFVEMLLLDGVFVIELARKWSLKKLDKENYTRYKDDYIFQYSEVHYNEVLIQIRRDLLMIENQVPFFILSKLFDLTREDADNNSLHQLLLRFFRRIIPGEPGIDDRIRDYEVDDHLLGLVYQAYFSDINIDAANNHEIFMFHEINSTSELQEAGIKFRKAETTILMNVQFKEGVLEIPKLEVGDVTESIFRNLIAYEQVRVDDDQTKADDSPRYVTEYCFLMQFLVNSKKDVEILRRAGIVINWMGDDETLRLFFNKLTKNVATSQDFYYAKIIKDMNEYSGRYRNKWFANLMRIYLNGPWAILSVVAAFILLVLTAGQMLFAVLSYAYGTPTRPK